MRTTIDIPNAVYRRLKGKAALNGRSVRARPVDLPLVRSRRPGTRALDNARIYDLIARPCAGAARRPPARDSRATIGPS